MKPSSDLSRTVYCKDGLLVTNTQILSSIFGTSHTLLRRDIQCQLQPQWTDQLNSLDVTILDDVEATIELTCRGFEHLMLRPTRRLYWRQTYTRILKQFHREHARLLAANKPSILFLEAN